MSVLRSQEGQIVQVLSDRVCIKLKSTHSPNSMAVVTVDVPPDGFVPPHTHTQEEESYYMLEGSMVMQLGSEEFTIEPGDFVHVPAGTIHGYRNNSDQPIRFLAWTIGGSIDEFFIEMSTKIREIPKDLPKMPEILEKYGVKMVIPPE
ncbi:cupin domain-containing protein [Calothrix sp. NIES-3974]|uniref:cupin domain-containing protein n=1 Tax=Calothrix sp. NIES-3974 TaxID=2005462 RepID=UPI000B60CD2E|nr:cupin domain-containing protein [Calothrix sp. NIES-3974]BAZ05003.1 cupin 2 conserved barrel domain protein [Calothrix sp. NIES-3974]